MARADGELRASRAAALPDDAGLPLSAAQLRWWVAQQLYPEVPNTVALYLELRGPFEVEALRECAGKAAWELQSPHVRFRLDGGYPRQVLDPDAFAPMDYEDLTDHPDPEAAALVWMEHDHASALDLLTDRLTVARLFRVDDGVHLLYLRSHHIVLDGLGAASVLQRTFELYSATMDSANVKEPPSPLGIAGLLAEECAYSESARARTDGDYWSEQVAGMGEPACLAGRPASRPRPPHRLAATVPTTTAARLAEWRQRSGHTFPELTIAAFACYLAAMTGADEIVLSLPVAARPSAALRRSAVSVSNVVPLRLSGFREITVGEAVERVRARLIGALRHQRYRYEDIQRDRGVNHTARGGFGPVVNMLGAVEPLRMGSNTARIRLLSLGPVEDLMINGYQLGPDEDSITIDIQANPELYSAQDLAVHHRRFLEYLDRFLADPQRAVRSLDSAGVVSIPAVVDSARLLPDLLRSAVLGDSGGDRVLDAVAVQDGSRIWTYRELDELSSRWARELIAAGAGPGAYVLVAVPRSAESVLAVWAVAKTGAAFAPIDTGDPARRSAAVAADSGARWGLTTAAVRAALPPEPGWLMLDDPDTLDRVRRRSAAPIDDTERTRPLHPDHPAYLIYTSGTTGAPKGVVVTHRGLGPLTDYIVEHYGVDRNSRVLHAHAPSFDAHLLELLAAFAGGARLIVEPPAVIAGADLAALLNEAAITHFLTTPAVLATLTPARVPALRVAVVGGEACPADLIARWTPSLRLFNGYCPTETTVMATQSDALTPGGPVPIGPPLPGVRALILDDRLRPAPPCGQGELYLGGPGVAAGYRGRPVATAERFLADPAGTGQRVYRTGDLVRRTGSGALEFLARADDQLTVRGRRAEPAEVAAALTTLPEIAHAVVTAHDGPRGLRLIGYVVAAPGSPLDHPDLIRRLRELLPAALVPAQLVELDRLPVTAHGKIDRAALPDPPSGERPYSAPESGVETLVAAQFAAITGAPRVGRDDDFFELGGNSLLGVALSAELATATGMPVTVRWLYAAPTVREHRCRRPRR
ncbi:non-ribosomal peptide synthetase [Nocardia crassostreae]|uniref:non-ribosomal peptide synthetase n=1 Tax=Nocardia crassostreae TaxID=53428 RepID=UPI000835328F|nr:non-ribosomal peptide synthetase [Nocardia crassostreae]